MGQGPPQHWQGMEDRERLPLMDSLHNSMQVGQQDPPSHTHTHTYSFGLEPPPHRCSFLLQRVDHSQEDLYPPPGGLRPDERLLPHYPQEYQPPHRDLDYQRAPPGGEDDVDPRGSYQKGGVST